jgi:hypothetical protein
MGRRWSTGAAGGQQGGHGEGAGAVLGWTDGVPPFIGELTKAVLERATAEAGQD